MLNITKAGSIDEKGYLAGMTRRGYSEPKCVLELGANSLDSIDKVAKTDNFVPKMVYDVRREKISQIDNGCGMLAEAAANMFAMHRENHSDEPSRGVSGIGAKPSLSILSGKTHVDIFTRAVNGPHLHISVPWDLIHSSGRYSEMVEICLQTPDEQAEFHKEREDNGMLNAGAAHGTSIRFNYRDDLRYLLESNFLPIADGAALKSPLDRMGIVFGHDDVEMVLKTFDSQPRTLQPYDYFALPDSKYYTGKTTAVIEHIRSDKDGHDRFLLRTGDGYMEIKKDGRGLAKNPEKMTAGRFGYRMVGEFEVVCGLRLDTDIFNPDVPVKYDTAKKNPGHFNEEHLGDNEEFLGSYKLIRNNQTIGLIPPPDYSLSSARANVDSYLSYMLVQVELRFNPVSKQDNYQDIVVGIQENKNQFDGSNVPKQLTRLVAFVKAEKVKQINSYFKGCLDSVSQVGPVAENPNSVMNSPLITSLLTAAVPSVAMPSVAMPSVAMPSASVPSVAVPSVAMAVPVIADDSHSDSDEAQSASPSEHTPNQGEPVIHSSEEDEDIPQIIFGSDLLSKLQAIIDPIVSYDEDALNQLLARLVSEAFTGN